MKPLLKPSSPSNLYHATMRSTTFGLPSRNQITRVDLRELVVQIRMGAGFEQWLHGNSLLEISVSGFCVLPFWGYVPKPVPDSVTPSFSLEVFLDPFRGSTDVTDAFVPASGG